MESKPPKIIILGSTGFVGSALLDAFQKLPDIEVLGLNSSDLDLTTDRAAIELPKIVDKNTILIFAVRANRNLGQFEGFQRDVSIVKNVGRCLSQNPVRKCIYLSGGPVYNDSKVGSTYKSH